MFLVEKHKPKTPSDLLFNEDIHSQLTFLSTYEDVPHIIISGPPGGGKKTLVGFLLESIYGPSVNKVIRHSYNVGGSSAKKVVEVVQSENHIVIVPSNTNHDRYALQEIIKKYATNKSFEFQGRRKYKTIVITNIENLANNSQAALRRTMEIYARTCRFIMICNNLSKIFDPLRSRCRIFCVGLPSLEVIDRVIDTIAIKEGIQLSNETRKQMIKYSGNSLKKAIWFLECRRMGHEKTIILDEIFEKIIIDILSSSETKDIVGLFANQIRPNIYNTLITTIRGSDIIITIMNALIERIDDDNLVRKIIQFASDAEFNHIQGRREIMHIDHFISNVMWALRAKADDH
jgi:replication factor C subunit 3/5